MKKIERILIPIDFSKTSEVATSIAIKLAKLLKAEVFLIHVIEFNAYDFSIIPENQIVYPTIQELETVAEKQIDDIRKKINKQFGILSKTYITTGQIHSEIISFSKKEKIDLIVMGTHGVAGYKELFVGSNAFRVVTLSEIPVLTIQENADKSGFKNILIPIDNSIHSREKVNITLAIAGLFESNIHVVGLPDSKDKQELDKFKIKLESVEKIIRSEGFPYITTMLHGNNLAESALKYAKKNKCDLIVINTGHESKMTGIFLGLFAQQIVNHSKVPVLSVKHSEGYFVIETPGFGIS